MQTCPGEERWLRLFATAPQSSISASDPWPLRLLCWLDDAPENRETPGFRQTWNGFLRLWNVLQFLPHCFFVEKAQQGQLAFSTLPDPARKPGPESDPEIEAWEKAAEFLLEHQHVALLENLQKAGCPRPETGYELVDERGRPVANAEMAWESRKLALILPEDGIAELFQAQGWASCSIDEIAKTPEKLIKLLRNEG